MLGTAKVWHFLKAVLTKRWRDLQCHFELVCHVMRMRQVYGKIENIANHLYLSSDV